MELPIRKTGVRRQRNKVSVDGGSVPRVQPTQDPGVNATQGAFGEQQAEDLFDTGESIRKFAEDRSDRLLKAQERIRAKQVLNSVLSLIINLLLERESFNRSMLLRTRSPEKIFLTPTGLN